MGMEHVDQELAIIKKKLNIYLKPQAEVAKERKVPSTMGTRTVDDLITLFDEITDICVSQLLNDQGDAASFMISDLRNMARSYL